MNNKSYYACEIDNIEEESYISINSVNEIFLNEISFEIFFYPKTNIRNYELVHHIDNIFTIGVKNNNPYFMFFVEGVKNTVYFRRNEHKIYENSWNNLVMTISKTKVSLFLGGYFISTKEINTNIFNYSLSHLTIGNKFTGFIKSIKIYDKEISDDLFYKYMYKTIYNKERMPNILAFIQCEANKDKTKIEIKEIGESIFLIDVKGICNPSSVMHACIFSGTVPGGLIERNSSINPGGFESMKFSIYIKFYVKNEEMEHIPYINVLISNMDEKHPNESFAIECCKDVGGMYIAVEIGEKYGAFYYNHGVLEPEKWLNLVAVYDPLRNKKLSIYINNEEEYCSYWNEGNDAPIYFKESEGNLKIGSMKYVNSDEIGYRGFSGAIASIAIFDIAISKEEVEIFTENEPFIYEDGLKALYNFDDGINMIELLSGRRLYFEIVIPSIELIKIENTFLDSPYQYRINKTVPNIPMGLYHKAEMLLVPLIEYYKMYGLVINEEEKKIILFIMEKSYVIYL